MTIRIETAHDGTLYFKDKHITWTLGETVWKAWFNGEIVAVSAGTAVPSDEKLDEVRAANSPWLIEKTLDDVMKDVENFREELYYSTSKKQHMAVSEMHTLHLVNAVRKELATTDGLVDCLRDPWFRAALAELALWRHIPEREEREEDEIPF